jgi:hypothetical protein
MPNCDRWQDENAPTHHVFFVEATPLLKPDAKAPRSVQRRPANAYARRAANRSLASSPLFDDPIADLGRDEP